MTIDEALEKIFSLRQFHVKLGLDQTKRLLKYLGNPERKFKAIHIAGSNGKGSAASFIASVLKESGMKVGLYTSPHFVKFNERIRIDGEMISDKYILDFLNGLTEYIDKYEPTFFEITTALAFQYFSENDLDVAVIEVGLGGRLDATNVISPLASVITTISYEHTNILGDTLGEIAKEKAAIIKENGKVFVGYLPEEAEKVVVGEAKKKSSEIFLLKKYLTKEKDYVILDRGFDKINIYRTPLPGYHQLLNASLAIKTVGNLFPEIAVKNILDGINRVVRNSGIQGRFEVVRKNPLLIFDAAHNADGVKVFCDTLKQYKFDVVNSIVIFGALIDKDIKRMLERLSKCASYFYIASVNSERAALPEDIMKIGKELGLKISTIDKPAETIKNNLVKPNGKNIFVLGSIYLLGEIKLEMEDLNLTF
ncbi:MAG: bifunctional folylpolyglutamate synthase/dihydrofolate synthase [Chlorobi bacterium]|nr:bifunctional folylpolyglutamate synthase/dihydrofolate synthase [Chlorobiota bacterium]